MAIRIVITDAFSSIGQAILAEFETTHFSVLTPASSEQDWTDVEAVTEYVQVNQVQVIINTLGFAEYQTVEQQVLCLQAAKTLAEVCKSTDIVPIHMSSFRVFGGENKSSYDEYDKPLPVGASGRAYWEAERAFESVLDKYICLRLGRLLDYSSDTYFNRLLEGLKADDEFIVTDQRRSSPIDLPSVAKVVVAIMSQALCGAQNWGAFHYASGDTCTEVELAEVVEKILWDKHRIKATMDLSLLNEEELVLDASEPVSSVLTIRRCRDDFGVQPKSWRQNLTTLVALWIEQQQALLVEN